MIVGRVSWMLFDPSSRRRHIILLIIQVRDPAKHVEAWCLLADA